MKALRLPTVLTAAFALALVLTSGCSDQNPGTDPTVPGDEDPDISAQFGGYSPSDELPAFGDDELVQDLQSEVSVSDAVEEDPETRDLANDPNGKSYALTLRWGVLERKPNGEVGNTPQDAEKIDWSGSLSTGVGRIVLRQVFSFEDGDEADLPREDPTTLEWHSTTEGGVDGITIVLYVPEDMSGDLTREGLVLDTAAFDLTLTLAQLADWDETYDVGDQGNQIRVNAMETGAAASARGWVLGRWGWDAQEDLGRFEGQWVHPKTGISGFLRGHFGPDPSTDRVTFYGKYINRSGDFEGLLRGTVQVSSGNLERGLGTFQGGWFSETGEAEGAVRGRWVAGGERGGYFSGIWCSTCPVQDGLGGNGNDDDTGNTGNEGDDADDAGGNADDVGGSDGGGNGGDIGGANGGGNGGDAGGSGGGN